MASTLEKIRELLERHFAPSHLVVEDDSAKHAGHAGARSGGGHYVVVLVSERFVGKNPIAQHREVYAVLETLMGEKIHALALQTYSPEQWKV